jgi:hypothetical protein
MTRSSSTIAALVLLTLAVVLLFIWNSSSDREATRLGGEIALLQRSVDSLKAQAPGLGDDMTTIQLHVSKLWFAGQAANWKLVKFELDELGEAFEAAEALHARKNDVDVSLVLMSTRTALFPLIEKSVEKKSPREFGEAYRQLLVACNGCHKPAGYEFIHIITPTREPVTNQDWKVGGR